MDITLKIVQHEGDCLSVSYDDLRPKQKRVVRYEGGPLLVLAGPGTGKTEVLAHRIAYLITQKKVPPDEILAITFTKKATDEMLERLKEFGSLKDVQPHVSTLHAVSLNLLTDTMPGLFEFIADEDETLMLMKDAADDLDIKISHKELKKVANRIALLKANDKFPDEADKIDTIVRDLYKRYEQLLVFNRAIDLDGLVIRAVRSISSEYAPQIRHLLVDEFQDINRVEYKLIQILSRRANSLFVVGDDDQSIYGWRGADPTIIWDFENTFKGAKTETLEESVRCPGHFLKGALGVVSKCSNYKPKPIQPAGNEGNLINVLRSSSEVREARWIAEWIAKNTSSGYVEPQKIAILCPQLKLSEYVVKELRHKRVKVTFWRSGGIFASKAVRDILAYIRIFINRDDNLALRRCLESSTGWGIGAVGIRELRRAAEKYGHSLWEVLNNPRYPKLNRWRPRFKKFAQAIDELHQKTAKLQLEQAVHLIAKEVGATGGEIRKLGEFARSLPVDISLLDFLKEVNKNRGLDLEWGGPAPDEKENAVAVMSMHAAKGLTYDVIFVVGMDEDIFPNPTLDMDEQRRLCYVAMTRARKELFLCHSRRRVGPPARGQFKFCDPSRFISDIPNEHKKVVPNPY